MGTLSYAEKARKKSIEAGKYKEWSYEDVIEAIDKQSELGKMKLEVDPCYISEETKNRLEKEKLYVGKSYSVNYDGMPWFWIEWDGFHYISLWSGTWRKKVMIIASREATRKAIRTMISKHKTDEIVIDKSYKDNELPRRSGKEGIHYKFFRNVLGAELIYK